MINNVYERKLNKTNSVIIREINARFEILIMDYNAICCRNAMLLDEVFLWDYVPTFNNKVDAIVYVDNHINDLI